MVEVSCPLHRARNSNRDQEPASRFKDEQEFGMKHPANGEGGASFQHVHDEPHPDDRPAFGIEQLVQQLKETADKLVRDGANRGDVKLLSTALKELRYAFKGVAPYRRRRKVTIFGSARLPSTDPAYQQAVIFSRMAAEAGYMVITGAASGIMQDGT